MTEELHDLMEQYFSNQMNSEEKLQFEARLENEPELRKSFDEFKQVSEVLEADVEQKFRERFREIDETETPKKSTFNKYWVIATIILGVLIVSMAFVKQIIDVNPQQIAANYGLERNVDKARTMLPKEAVSEDELQYYAKMEEAAKYIDAKEFAEARRVYESLDTKFPIVKDNKEWAIALSYYLEEGRSSEKFQKTLQAILKNLDHNCYHLAVQVDNEVNSFWGRFK